MSDPSRPLPAPSVQDMTAFHIYRAWSAANALFTRLCEGRFNITRREWRILATLVNHPDGLGSSELARAASLDTVRTSRAISSLCQKGWLARSRARGNARLVHVAVTAEGVALYDALMPEIVALNRLITQDLSADQRETLHATLDTIAQRSEQLQEAELIKERGHRGLSRERRP